jgi:hypothetical protein
VAHIVCRQGRYYSLEESYREGKKVKKRTLAYYGTRKPSDPQARMEQMLATAERKAEAIDEAQRREFGETAAERQEREKEEAKFSQEKFLGETAQAKDDAPGDNAQDSEEGGGDEGRGDGVGDGSD